MSPLNPVPDLYAELEVSPNATEAAITSSYRRLSLLHHPDKNHNKKAAATAKMKNLNNARDILTDVNKRSEYDRLRKASNVQPPRAPSGTASHSTSSNQHADANKRDSDYGYGYGHNDKRQSASSNSDNEDSSSEADPKLYHLKQKWVKAMKNRDSAATEWKFKERLVLEAGVKRNRAAVVRDGEAERSRGWKQAHYELQSKESVLESTMQNAKKAKDALAVAEELVEEAARAWRKAAPCA